MKISLNWLNDYLDLSAYTPQQIGQFLTSTGLEVEAIEPKEAILGGLQGFVIGQVLTCERFEIKEKQLSLCTVNIGTDSPSQIVCGAANVAAGQKVIVATVGTTLYDHKEGKAIFQISSKKTYGHLSEGMICAEDELGIGTSHDGIMVLDTDLPLGTPASKYFKLEADQLIEIGLTPNRADAASHWGVARDLKALLKQALTLLQVADFKIDNTDFPIDVVVEDTAACPRFCGLTIDGVTVGESPEWLKKRLAVIGIRSINNIVDITNYVNHDLGQPLHAYDWHAIQGQKIIVKCAEEGSTFITLDGVERNLSATDLMVCNAHEAMGIAGIFGGTKSGINDQTTRIFLEVAYFAPGSIRKTAMRHGLKTDASFRFERGTDPAAKIYALQRAALMVQALAGGKIASEVVDIYPKAIPPHEVNVTFKNINRLIGKELSQDLIVEILQSLDIVIENKTESGFKAVVPAYRVDVSREADIVEEILRIYGLDNVELSENLSADFLAKFPAKDKEKTQFKLTQYLAGMGFQEIFCNSLTKPTYAQAIKGSLLGQSVEVLNKLSEDLGVLRQTLLFSGLEALAHNINRRQKDLRFFEFGKTYHKINEKYVEKNRLALFITGQSTSESWQGKSQTVAFHDLSAAVQKVLVKLNVKNFEIKSMENNDVFSYGLSYVVNKKEVVNLGLVKANLGKMADIKQTVFFADFDWDYLFKQNNNDVVYQEMSKYPEVRRDLSLVMDKAISFEQVKAVAYKYEKNLLQGINVFDVYEGTNLGEDKKSYSVSFILQDSTQTLTDATIDKTMQKLMNAFEKELNAVIRK